MRGAALVCLLVALAGCANAEDKKRKVDDDLMGGSRPSIGESASNVGTGVAKGASDGVKAAVSQPLEDVGILKEEIPDVLKAISYPYALEPTTTCRRIAEEVAALDAALGHDVDVTVPGRTMSEKGGDAAGNALEDAAKDLTSDVIPYSGVVRRISGASDREKKKAAAEYRGRLRRSFLKGVGLASGCLPPAAPLPFTPKPEKKHK